jgi:hypothetical protein
MQLKTRIILALVIGLISMFIITYSIGDLISGLVLSGLVFMVVLGITSKGFWERHMRKMDKREKREQELNKIRQESGASEMGRQEVRDEFQRQKRR